MDTSLTQYPVIQVKTLRFEYLIIFLNSYAPQIWTQPYFHHNIRKYELTLPLNEIPIITFNSRLKRKI